MVRTGINFAVDPKNVYKIPFSMDGYQYELSFHIGHDHRLGLLEDFDKKGELLIPLYTNEIQECYNISMILYRLAMFMMSQADVPFKRIILYKSGQKVGWFYCPLTPPPQIYIFSSAFFHFITGDDTMRSSSRGVVCRTMGKCWQRNAEALSWPGALRAR